MRQCQAMYEDDLDRMIVLASQARVEATWQGFANYLKQHGKGTRKSALVTLKSFIDEAVVWQFDARLSFTLWLLGEMNADAIVQPLKMRLLIPTLKEWQDREPLKAEAHLWLGLLHCDNPIVHLQRAIELNSQCQKARERLCSWIIGDISYNQHELPAFYIHDPKVDLLDLAEAEALCIGYEGADWAIGLLPEIFEQRQLAEDWLRDHPRPGDFASH
jgi:hypothetical protein